MGGPSYARSGRVSSNGCLLVLNIIIYPTQDVVIKVLTTHLLMPYGIGTTLSKKAKYDLFRQFYPYFRRFRRVGPDSTRKPLLSSL